jgi:putative transposase
MFHQAHQFERLLYFPFFLIQESITQACGLFGYSRQVYYRSLRSEKLKQQRAEQVIRLVQEKRMLMPRLGTRKLYYLLEDELNKIGVGRDKLFDILRANHLLVKHKRSYHKTTNSYHRFKKHKNRIKTMDINKPEQVWVADITYIGTKENPMYLSLITDAYSKRIMGFNVSNSLSTNGALTALKDALRNRKYPNTILIHHSDRGLQYCSNQYQNELNKGKVLCSMTES